MLARQVKGRSKQTWYNTAFDTQLAMTQAEQAQQYDLDTRLATANLELSNQKELMKDTFSYGTQKMAMEYDLQSRFAVDDAARDLNKMAWSFWCRR